MQDLSLMFDVAGDLTAAQYGNGAAGTTQCPNWVDTFAVGTPKPVGPSGGTIGGPLLHDFGRSRNRLKIDARIVTAVTSAGAATVEFDLVSAPDNAGAVNTGAISTIERSAAIAKAQLVVGYRYYLRGFPGSILDPTRANVERYVTGQVVIATAALTAGKLTAGLQLDTEDHADIFG